MSFMKERKVQQYIEALDRLKLNYSTANTSGGKIPLQQQDNSIGEMPTPTQKKPLQNNKGKIPLQQQDNSIRITPITEQKQTIQSNGGKILLQQQDNSTGKMAIPKQKQSVQSKQRNDTMQMPTQKQQRPVLSNSESFVVTTAWETFD